MKTAFLAGPATATAIALFAAAPLAAQEQGASGLSHDRLHADGFSVEAMLDAASVMGDAGSEIGRVENVIFSDQGLALSIVAEVDAAEDGEPLHVNVPWDRITFGESFAEVRTPVGADTLEEFDMFGDYWDDEQVVGEVGAQTPGEVSGALRTGPGIFRAASLIGDYAYLGDGTRYGYIADLIVVEGALAAVVMDLADSGRPGYYAYPFDPEGRGTDAPGYRMSMTKDEADAAERFDHGRMVEAASQ